MSSNERTGLIARSVENISAVLRRILPGGGDGRIHAGPADAVVALVALLLTGALGLLALDPGIPLSYWEVRFTAGGFVLHLLAVGLAAFAVGRGPYAPPLVVGTAWALTLGTALALVLAIAFPPAGVTGWLLRGILPVILPPVLFVLSVLGAARGGIVALALLASMGLSVADTIAERFAAPETVAELPDTEAVYAAQAELLRRQVSALRPGVPGKPELFAVLGAGDPTERVFRREVEAVAGLLAERFGAGNRIIRMVNSRDEPTALPLLNRTNLTAALRAQAAAMDPEDILLVYLTSHGAPGFVATLFEGVATRDLMADDVARALQDSGVRNVVAIVSACYSGSFVGGLAAPDRLVLTAADEDRSSFGCADENEWTYWGEAFFVDALAETADFREAAAIARVLVAEREAEEGFPPSQPQIVEGAEIGAALDRWLAEMSGR